MYVVDLINNQRIYMCIILYAEYYPKRNEFRLKKFFEMGLNYKICNGYDFSLGCRFDRVIYRICT